MSMNDDIFREFNRMRRNNTDLTPKNPAIEANPGEFYQQLHHLHTLFMEGDITLGEMAVRMGLTKPDIIHLLDRLNMQVTNL